MNRARLAGCIVVLTILQGCSLINGSNKTPTAVDIARQELSLIDTHLSLMHDITSGNYQRQVDLFAEVVAEREEDATVRNRFREAITLITSGHPNSDRGRGYSALKSLLEYPGELTNLEIRLATVLLNETENVMILEAQNAELSTTLSNSQVDQDQRGDSERKNLNQARRELRAAQQAIDTLEVELAEARAKLDAIKRIETASE